MDTHRKHTERSGPSRESSRNAKVGTRAWLLLCSAILLAGGALGCGGLQVYNFGGEGRGQAFHVPQAAAMKMFSSVTGKPSKYFHSRASP